MSEIITRGNFLKGGIATILASGVAPSILMADSRSAGSIGGLRRGLGARVGMMEKNIPYERVNYVQSLGGGAGSSSGTRIDTGLPCKDKYIMEIDAQAINAGVLVGCWASGTNPRVYYIRYIDLSDTIALSYYASGYNVNTGRSNVVRHLFRTEMSDKIKLWVDGHKIGEYEITPSLSENKNLGLFYNNSTSSTDNVSARLWGMKVWRLTDGRLIRNYIPVKATATKGGLYDVANDQLKVNESSSQYDLTFG